MESVTIKTSPVDDRPIDLIDERMRGVANNYHFLPLDTNSSTTGECVYEYLLAKYGTSLKTVTKQKPLNIFGETDTTSGVSTRQSIKFCEKYKIPAYLVAIQAISRFLRATRGLLLLL